MHAPLTAAFHDPLLKRIADLFTPDDYLVGGCVRDFCLGVPPADFDILSFGDVWQLAERIALRLGSHAFWMDKTRAIARIATGEPPIKIDVCAPKAAAIAADLAERDITINALALHPASQALIDPLGGLADLEQGRIRVIAEKNLADDPLRVLRCLRFSLQLNFTLTEETNSAMRRQAPRLTAVAPERIKQELNAALALKGGARIFELMQAYGLPVFPQYVDIDQGKHHRWPLIRHAVLAALETENLLDNAETYLPGIGAYFAEQIEDGLPRAGMLKLASFLHDIGKPDAHTLDADGAVHFYGHAQAGARQTADILKSLRYANQTVRIASGIVEHHMRVLELAVGGVITNRAMHRFLSATIGFTPELLLLTIADAEATGKDPAYAGARPDIEAIVRRIWTYYREVFCVTRPAPLLSGHDIMQALDIPPGPRVKEALVMVEEARADGLVQDRDKALAYLKKQKRS